MCASLLGRSREGARGGRGLPVSSAQGAGLVCSVRGTKSVAPKSQSRDVWQLSVLLGMKISPVRPAGKGPECCACPFVGHWVQASQLNDFQWERDLDC